MPLTVMPMGGRRSQGCGTLTAQESSDRHVETLGKGLSMETSRSSIVPVLIGAVLALSSCGNGASEDAGPSACRDAIQFEGTQYAAWERAKRVMSPVGFAIRGECADVSPADGLTFPEDGEAVEVGTFDGFDQALVLGAEGAEGEFYVYVSDDVSEERAQRVVARLTGKGQRE